MNIRNGATSRKRSIPQLSRTAVLARGRRAEIGIKRGSAGSSGGAVGHIGNRPGVLRHDFGWWDRRNLRPSLAQPNGLVHAHEELLFAVIAPPPPAAVELKKMRAAAICQGAPFLRDLLECMRGLPFRHGEACIGSRFTMWDRVGSTRKQRLTAHCYPLSRITHRITADIIVRFRGRQGEFRQNGVQASAQASPRGGCMPPKTDPPGRGNPGGSR